MFVWFCHEFHANLFFAFKDGGRDAVGFVFEFRNAIFACVVHGLNQHIVDEDVELVGFPFAYAPILQSETQFGVAFGLHQVAEIVAVAGIAEEHVVRVASLRFVGFHLVVGLWLLFAWLHLIHCASFECLTFLLFLCEVVDVLLITTFGECQPIHHVTTIVNLKERLQFAIDFVLHSSRKGEMQRLSSHRSQLIGNALDVVVDEDRCLVDRKFWTSCILTKTAVVGYQGTHGFGARLHA